MLLLYSLFIVREETVLVDLQALVIREKLAGLYESEQEWSKAAQMLSGIDLDSGMRYGSEQQILVPPYVLFSCLFGFVVFCII